MQLKKKQPRLHRLSGIGLAHTVIAERDTRGSIAEKRAESNSSIPASMQCERIRRER